VTWRAADEEGLDDVVGEGAGRETNVDGFCEEAFREEALAVLVNVVPAEETSSADREVEVPPLSSFASNKRFTSSKSFLVASAPSPSPCAHKAWLYAVLASEYSPRALWAAPNLDHPFQ